MIWFISLFISLAIVTYIAWPFIMRRQVLSAAVNVEDNTLQLRRDHLLRSLKELEFDHRTEKIDTDEFQTIRSGLAEEAANVLASLESPKQAARSGGKAGRSITNGTKIKEYAIGGTSEDEAELLIARARRKQATSADIKQSDSWTCGCGRTMPINDRFCGSCGKPHAS